MRRAVVVGSVVMVLLTAALGALGSPRRIRIVASCPGVERWDVKTLTDGGSAGARSVHFSPVVRTTVALLRTDKPAARIRPISPRQPGERAVYRVRATLVKAETVLKPGSLKGDEDIHLVIAEPGTNKTMIAEFPKSGCIPESNSAKAARMDRARAALVAACGSPPLGRFKLLAGTATITGVGFFDVKHATPQTGRAPYDRELHPVLSFRAAGCRPAAPHPRPQGPH